MPHVSKRKLDVKTKKLLIDALTTLLSNSTHTETDKVLSVLLTGTERLMVAKRVGAALLISESITESEIAESLKITRFTVSKYMLIVKLGDKATWNFILKKLETWHEFTMLKSELKKLGIYALKKFSRGMAGKV